MVGDGVLRLRDFRQLIAENPRVSRIELANYGEVLLNPELAGILECAHAAGVQLSLADGVNMNNVSTRVLESLVKYRLARMTCSIDGASEETYRLYRGRGDFAAVMENLRRLKALKDAWGSDLPLLTWQFVVFGHNEHEIPLARELARALGMSFRLKLAWDAEFSPAVDKDMLRREIGAASRDEYRERVGHPYLEHICLNLWDCPQINWDGRVLGCCRNFWGEFGGNAFHDGLDGAINSPSMQHARLMLMGRAPAKDGIPCSTCEEYLERRDRGDWLTLSKVTAKRREARREKLQAGVRKTPVFRAAKRVFRTVRPWSPPSLASHVHPFALPLPPEEDGGWRARSLFNGPTRAMDRLTCSLSVLSPGITPHAPHVHEEEEILVLLAGELALILPEVEVRIGPGDFVYYPRGFRHTLRNVGDDPANYVMLKWTGPVGRRAGKPLSYSLHRWADAGPAGGRIANREPGADEQGGFRWRVITEGPTDYLRKLHCHASAVAPGAGYEPHVDEYDVALVLLAGEVETLGKVTGPHGVVFYAAGDPHGISNPGAVEARYLVFEFHPRPRSLADRVRGRRN